MNVKARAFLRRSIFAEPSSRQCLTCKIEWIMVLPRRQSGARRPIIAMKISRKLWISIAFAAALATGAVGQQSPAQRPHTPGTFTVDGKTFFLAIYIGAFSWVIVIRYRSC